MCVCVCVFVGVGAVAAIVVVFLTTPFLSQVTAIFGLEEIGSRSPRPHAKQDQIFKSP